MKHLTLLLSLLTVAFAAQGQEFKPLFQIILPTQTDWNIAPESSRIDFRLNSNSENAFFSLVQGRLEGMNFDSLGHFSWTPSYDIADRINTKKTIQLLIKAQNPKGETTTQTIDLVINHTNRPPQIEALQPYYVQFRSSNVYKIDAQLLRDDDADPVVIVPIPESLPEGMKLTSQGEFTWQPSQTQFNQLKTKPFYVDFELEDQPQKARSKGRIKVEATQLDLPPNIIQIPQSERYDLKENTTIDLKFYLSDPNGDDDIVAFDFVSDNAQVPTKALIKNTPNQYEFIWTPSYDFVKDPLDSLSFNITFFVIDKNQKRDERKIYFTVRNAVNEALKDKQLYSQYRSALVEAWNLLEQLSEKEQTLKQAYLQAKKGKRNRSVTTATLGAVTGISPVIIKTTDNRTIISAIGGTAILTIGTLEATEVIGKSLKDILERYNYVLEKKIEIQSKGDVFAREYALKSQRRTADYVRKKDEFKLALILKGPVTLDLDAGWENKKEATDKALSRSFKDFLGLED
jgi:hypothetical protein